MFSTHYDENDNHFMPGETLEPGDTDRHGNRINDHWQIEAESLERLVESMERENIIYIKGAAYQIESYGAAEADGSRKATLKLYVPF